MNEETKKVELTEEQKKQQEEIEKQRAEFRKLLDTPLTEDEAKKALAENHVNRCRLEAFVRRYETQIAQLRLRIEEAKSQALDLDGEDAIIRRRVLNKQA